MQLIVKNWSQLLILLLALVLNSCGAFGTKTLYKTTSNSSKPSKIGFSQIAKQDIIEDVAEGSIKIFDSVIINQLNTRNINAKKVNIESFDEFNSLKEADIKALCLKNQLDGMLFTELKFINVQYTTLFFIPIGVSEDTEVEMQYFNTDGKLLFHTKHNTHMGNSYWGFPSADKTVRDGTEGALGRILKELMKQKKPQPKLWF